MSMKIIFSPHSILKMEQRKLSRRDVVDTVTHSDFSRPSYGAREERYRKFGKSYLKVVVKKRDNQIIVITAHWVAALKNE